MHSPSAAPNFHSQRANKSEFIQARWPWKFGVWGGLRAALEFPRFLNSNEKSSVKGKKVH